MFGDWTFLKGFAAAGKRIVVPRSLVPAGVSGYPLDSRTPPRDRGEFGVGRRLLKFTQKTCLHYHHSVKSEISGTLSMFFALTLPGS